jgi:hypothetical protein
MKTVSVAMEYSLSVMELVNSINSTYKTEGNDLPECAIVTIDSVSNPHTCTIDFGTGCVVDSGKTKSGSVYVEYNNTKLGQPGAYAQVTFNNLSDGEIRLNGTFGLTNNGYNGSGNLSFSANVNVAADDLINSSTNNVQANLDIEWTAGKATKTHDDDLFNFTGSFSGTTPSGHTLSIAIMSPLELSRMEGCDYFTRGVMRIQEAGQPDKYLDYGDGTCDDQAIETIEGNSQVVSLEGYFK